jgi:hypothetical protein
MNKKKAPKDHTELPFGRLTRAVLHVLQDAVVQKEFFRWHLTRADFDDFSILKHNIQEALLEERKYDKLIGRRNFRGFDKGKFKPEEHSQKLMDEQAGRRKKRPQNILAAEGMIRRGTYPRHLSQKGSEVIVVNGVFPDEDIRPIPVVRIETLT